MCGSWVVVSCTRSESYETGFQHSRNLRWSKSKRDRAICSCLGWIHHYSHPLGEYHLWVDQDGYFLWSSPWTGIRDTVKLWSKFPKPAITFHRSQPSFHFFRVWTLGPIAFKRHDRWQRVHHRSVWNMNTMFQRKNEWMNQSRDRWSWQSDVSRPKPSRLRMVSRTWYMWEAPDAILLLFGKSPSPELDTQTTRYHLPSVTKPRTADTRGTPNNCFDSRQQGPESYQIKSGRPLTQSFAPKASFKTEWF